MFLVKEDFDNSLMVAQLYDGPYTEEVKITVAQNFARELFEEFDSMHENEKNEIIEMIIDDMSIDFYTIN